MLGCAEFGSRSVTMPWLRNQVAGYVSTSLASNGSLLTLPPVKPIDVVVARTALESMTYMFVGFIMCLALYLGGTVEAIPYDPLRVMEASALGVCVALGIGMINIVIQSFFHKWMFVYSILTFPLWMFSGIFFLPEQVPPPFREYMLYNPVLHVVLMFRTGFYSDYKAVFLDASYLISVSCLLLVTGLTLMQVARRKVLEPI